MFLSASETSQISTRLLDKSRVDSCVVSIRGDHRTNLRFAQNIPTTNGSISELSVTIESHLDGRSGSVTVTSLEDDVLAQAVVRSETIARLLPANPELMPPLGQQTYQPGAGYDGPTATVPAVALAKAAGEVTRLAVDRTVEVTGYGVVGHGFNTIATSAGLFAYDRHTGARFTVTARNSKGTWSGWSGKSETRFDRLDTARLGKRAIDKAAHDAVPLDLDPGKYTVILEPSAVADLVGWVLRMMDARSAEEGRSFLSRKGGGTRLGEALFDEKVTVYSDPNDSIAPEPVFGENGLPQRRTVWIDGGIVRNLVRSRFWAKKMGWEPVARPRSFVMAGGSASIDQMIRDTKRGILVTRVWYTNLVDPRSLLLTGLTRDGNFFIENGHIVAPARNLRFNESAIELLSNVAAVGPSERTCVGVDDSSAISVPPLLVKEFTFSSRSSGI
jgi:predicted Zn-dependent protease